ncbi:MAG TPA: hypothetical protein VKQ28_14380 [Candidatus Acidoferrum sp.]|nr:hypothetical protein [Candidatus Acidoferrum sp.]
MKAPVSNPRRRFLPAGLTLSAALLCVSMWQVACEKPRVVGDVYTCKDRTIDVDANASTGVDQDTIVVCGNHKVKWKEKNQENWEVQFLVSPFQQGEKKIKKGDPPPSAVAPQSADTAFKYSITVNGQAHDPQIIIMGGS